MGFHDGASRFGKVVCKAVRWPSKPPDTTSERDDGSAGGSNARWPVGVLVLAGLLTLVWIIALGWLALWGLLLLFR
jgi:hypothetical protein